MFKCVSRVLLPFFLHFQRECVDANHSYGRAWWCDTSPAMSRLFGFVHKCGLKKLTVYRRVKNVTLSDDEGRKQQQTKKMSAVRINHPDLMLRNSPPRGGGPDCKAS